jgi:hypothetical protein
LTRLTRFLIAAAFAVGVIVVAPEIADANTPCENWTAELSGPSGPPDEFESLHVEAGERLVLRANSCDGEYCDVIDHDPLTLGWFPGNGESWPTGPIATAIPVSGVGAPGSIRRFEFDMPPLDSGPYGLAIECDPDNWIPLADVIVGGAPATDTAVATPASRSGPEWWVVLIGAIGLAAAYWRLGGRQFRGDQ